MGNRITIVSVLAGAALALAACGSDDESTAPTDATSGGELSSEALPDQSVDERAQGFADAVASGDCEELAEYAFLPALVPDPDDPTGVAGCKALESFAKPLAGLAHEAAAEFGTGGVSDGTVDGKNWSFDWIDENGASEGGDYEVFSYIRSDPQVGVDPAAGADFAGTAEDFVAALRDHDCHAAWATFSGQSPAHQNGDEGSFCKTFEEDWFGDESSLGSLLEDDPDVQPTELGGSLDGVFFSVPVEPQRTLYVITDVGKPGADQETGTGLYASFSSK